MNTTPAPALMAVHPLDSTALLPAAACPAESPRFPPACLGLVNMLLPLEAACSQTSVPRAARTACHRRS